MYKSMLTVILLLLGTLLLVHLMAGCTYVQSDEPIVERHHRHDNDSQVVIVGDSAAAEMEMGCLS